MTTLLNDAEESLAAVDYFMIVAYFVLVIAVGLWVSIRERKREREKEGGRESER